MIKRTRARKPHTHICTKCGKYYENLEEGFYKHLRGREGYTVACIKCIRSTANKNYQRKTERHSFKEQGCTRKNKHWTEEELMYLEKSWGSVTLDVMSQTLGRTRASVKLKACKIGLGDRIDNVDFLIKKEVAQLLGVDVNTVSRYINKQGLSMKRKDFVLGISYEDFVNWLMDKQEIINWSKVDKLGIESLGFDKFLLEKLVIESTVKNNRQTLTEKDKTKIIEMYKNGVKYEDIANKLNKEFSSVKWFLHTCFEKGLLEKVDYTVIRLNRFTWSEKEDKTLVTMFRQGYTLREISKELNRSLESVRHRHQKINTLVKERRLVI